MTDQNSTTAQREDYVTYPDNWWSVQDQDEVWIQYMDKKLTFEQWLSKLDDPDFVPF